MENGTASGLPAANWYPDPHGGHELRYWDGAAWTDNVADGGKTSVDAVAAVDTSSEPVLLTLSKAKEVRTGVGDPLINVYVTDKRLLLEYLTSTHIGATITGGLVGRAIAANVEEGRLDPNAVPAATVAQVLGSPHEVRTVDYVDVKKMLVRRTYGKDSVITLSSTRSTVNASKSAVISFDRAMFEQASTLLAGMMPGRVTVKS